MKYEQFTELREGLTALWSETPEAELELQFTGAVAQSHRALMASAYKGAVTLDIHEPQVARHIEALRSGPETHGWANAFLAMSLQEWAHRLPPPPDPALVPDWLIEIFLEFQFAGPALFHETGDAENFIAHLERWFDVILAGSNKPDEPILLAARMATETAHSHMLSYLTQQSVRHPTAKARQIHAHLMARDGHALAHEFPETTKRPRKRIGLYRHRWSGTELMFVLPILRHLDRSAFEVVLIADVRADPGSC